jgi:hypothetical protein
LPRGRIFFLALSCKSLAGLILVGTLEWAHQVATPVAALLIGASATHLLHRGAEHVSLPDGSVGNAPASMRGADSESGDSRKPVRVESRTPSDSHIDVREGNSGRSRGRGAQAMPSTGVEALDGLEVSE